MKNQEWTRCSYELCEVIFYVDYVKLFYIKQWKEISFLLHFVIDCIMEYPADFGHFLVSNLFGLQLGAKSKSFASDIFFLVGTKIYWHPMSN